MIMLNRYLRERFGTKVYKLALSAHVTCPNRDGKLGTRGCIFCSEGGSGDFAASSELSVAEQIEEAKKRVCRKLHDGKYVAYFQSFTNTYGKTAYLESIWREALADDDIVALSVATRPDCLEPEIVELLKKINSLRPVWVELGLQTIHAQSISYIRRGYETSVYDDAVKRLHAAGLEVVTHVILGLPGETEKMMHETVRHVVRSGADGIKLQLLHVLKGTDLEMDYRDGRVPMMTMTAYAELVASLLCELPENMVVHRLTGDGPKKLLVAPLWSGDKKRVLNAIREAALKKGISL